MAETPDGLAVTGPAAVDSVAPVVAARASKPARPSGITPEDISVAVEQARADQQAYIEQARREGAAAERAVIIQLARDRSAELADHSRQSQALPVMSSMLALKSDALAEFADMLDGAS
ncbi:MAG TPA: hypothetical protein VF506_16470 [Streptosporangiaceae bacterium]